MPDFLTSLLSNIWAIFLIILFFGGSIFVHELGHFLAARRRGLKVERFSIGMGPAIWRKYGKDGVEYRLAVFPIGGYVSLPQLADLSEIEGKSETDVTTLPPVSYSSKMLVLVAGAFFNIIFAFVLASVLWIIRQPVSAASQSTTIGYVAPSLIVEDSSGKPVTIPSPASQAGLQVGDRILRIDDRAVTDWTGISYDIFTGSNWTDDGKRKSTFLIERAGRQLSLEVFYPNGSETQKRRVGIGPAYDVLVGNVPPRSLAAKVGLQPKDRLLMIDDVPIRSTDTYSETLIARGAKELILVVQRQDQRVALTIPPRPLPVIRGIIRNSHAHRLGLQNGDALTAIDGLPIRSAREFITLAGERKQNPLKLTVTRGEQVLDFEIPARPDDSNIGIIPSQLLGESLSDETMMARISPITQCINVAVNSYRTLKSLLNPRSDVDLSLVSGPIEIIRVYHMVAQSGLRNLLSLTILVNISLAIFNLLPIPVLDGGQMMFSTIEKLRNKNFAAQLMINIKLTFIALLFGMILYVSYFNVQRWVDDSQSLTEDQLIRTEGPIWPEPPKT